VFRRVRGGAAGIRRWARGASRIGWTLLIVGAIAPLDGVDAAVPPWAREPQHPSSSTPPRHTPAKPRPPFYGPPAPSPSPRTPPPGAGTPSTARAPAPSTVRPGPSPALVAPEPERRVLDLNNVRDWASTRVLDGHTMIRVNDLARLLDATKFWRADVRKLELRARGHRFVLTVDNPFCIVDETTRHLPTPVRSLRGELQVPVAFVAALPRDSLLARLLFDPGRRVVLQVPATGLVERPTVAIETGETRLVFPVDRPEDVAIANRSRAHFRVHFSGLCIDAAPESLAARSLVRALRPIPTVFGTAFELAVTPETRGFRVTRETSPSRVVLTFAAADRSGFEAFAPEGPPGPRPLRVVVIDPGHGGADHGVTSNGLVEKQLTLTLARLVRTEIERRLPTRVVLTREDDQEVPMEARAERANRARADLVLSLHFDGGPSPGGRGATAYLPPATYGTRNGSDGAAATREIDVLPWRDVATRHAVESRQLAEDVLSSLELHAQGPTRLREILPYTLLGVNAPGLLLECATLTSPQDRARLTRPQGLAELAAGIADGIAAYQRSE
jgi:N-acetylmuramoyl-L-alanine amidase